MRNEINEDSSTNHKINARIIYLAQEEEKRNEKPQKVTMPPNPAISFFLSKNDYNDDCRVIIPNFRHEQQQQQEQQLHQLHKEKRMDEEGGDGCIVPPAHFLCPLTMEIMREPMMTRAGHSFEKSAILMWLQRQEQQNGGGGGSSSSSSSSIVPCCPLTRKPLTLRDLVLNHALHREINAWKSYHKYPGQEQGEHPLDNDTPRKISSYHSDISYSTEASTSSDEDDYGEEDDYDVRVKEAFLASRTKYLSICSRTLEEIGYQWNDHHENHDNDDLVVTNSAAAAAATAASSSSNNTDDSQQPQQQQQRRRRRARFSLTNFRRK